MTNTTDKRRARERRHRRVRGKIQGTAERPRLNVYRSNRAIYAQVIDDGEGRTIVAANSLEDGVAAEGDGKVGAARAVGELVGRRASEAGIGEVVFDRGGNRYHGRIAALADGAREAGLQF
ncbi:50S ribosomal protein L18 [Egibacter rhizosphaerae]|uniref:Large ribosomal subunit protein uL18 n=1 Tax=Egibacter rhizosphaerae TaxID=1670831 RepID=A0A411YH80_9ACTN|nr:50S ribosomal protein L18 [Egibacter rhizosphaerae]QBI20466.1 50S ribosomal protein L18 [Egibacter rhizosphaerae]